ncbi:uncharacterized protein L203_104528 [Cryptococcus depauperatus CBS 7841]|uniref:Uncharacterized protein n=1 Tax=Cryptococcus depauperatus CBS 7841 TaxID=1295531 RepID=A0A1E3IM98_9TREE|nr:hypothetical protein L203_02277 [Cryptococcus depauperatus CBS 7841]
MAAPIRPDQLPRREFGPSGAQKQQTWTQQDTTAQAPRAASTELIPPPGPRHTRSTSMNQGITSGLDMAFAADKAQQWLSNWAPKGEGRGREFLMNGINGVASVASQVSNGLNGRLEKETVLGDVNKSTNDLPAPSVSSASSSTSTEGRHGFSTSSPVPKLAEGQNANGLVAGRQIPQPANLARLGHSATTGSAPTIARPGGLHQTRPSNLSSTASTTSLPNNGNRSSVHGPSHLGPNIPAHQRTFSSESQGRPSSFVSGVFASSASRSSSMTGQSTAISTLNTGVPYKVGFQPQGVRSDRTEEYLDAREEALEEIDKEEGRLNRRWAKLVDLHFNPFIPQIQTAGPQLSRSPSSSLSITSLATDKRRSLLSFDVDSLKPKEVFKGIKAGVGPGGEEGRKRAAEQAIVKWEDDSTVRRCRICASSFSLSNRKHHCRLCGRIVCSLPPTPSALLAIQIQLFAPIDPTATSTSTQVGLPPGTRREKCSLLLVADWRTGRGEEVEERFVGWMKLEDDHNALKSASKREFLERNSVSGDRIGPDSSQETRDLKLPQQPKEVQVKGMRVCRDCWAIISRKQKIGDRQRITGFSRLYHGLRSLQFEIESLLSEYEEHLAGFTSSLETDKPLDELLTLHRQLIVLFTDYEHLSKKISSAPCKVGSSQAQVQSSIARSAATFMTKEMAKLQTVPKLQKKIAEAKRKGLVISETTLEQLTGPGANEGADEDVQDVALLLQPLLEQESQLESYIADANAQRKYEDGKALQEALREIRDEIKRITLKAGR